MSESKQDKIFEAVRVKYSLHIGNQSEYIYAPNLRYIGKHAYFMNWDYSAPKLRTIKGKIIISEWKGTAPKLTSINGRKFRWAKFWEQ